MRRSTNFVSTRASATTTAPLSLLVPPTTLRTAQRTYIISSHLNPVLEQRATSSGYEAPMWVDTVTLRRPLLTKSRIAPRRGEQPTSISFQQKVGLFNLDQLRAGPKAMDFLKNLPKSTADPYDVISLQPYRGVLADQLRAVASNNQWGPFWISSQDFKWRGFFKMHASTEPPAWRSHIVNGQVYNFSQLESQAGIDLKTIPINCRYAQLMIGSDVGEQLRNEALRRNLTYPVACSARNITMTGCSLIPEMVSGFRLETNVGAGGSGRYHQNRGGGYQSYNNNNNNLVYNLDEFVGGAAPIEKALQLPRASEPTFAFSGTSITRQLIVQDMNNGSSSSSQNDEEQVVGMNSNNKKENGGDDASSSEEDKTSFSSHYWLRVYEADQLSGGEWRLKSNARGATLGDPLAQQQYGGGGGRAARLSAQQQDAEITDDLLSTSSSKSAHHLPQIVTLSSRLLLQRAAAAAQLNSDNNSDGIGAGGAAATGPPAFGNDGGGPPRSIYYFDVDVKERKEFLAALGTFMY